MTPKPEQPAFTTTEVSSSKQRALLTAMVTSDRFLREVASLYNPEYMDETFRLIADWCLEYGEQYGQAPKAEIQRIFEEYAAAGKAPPARIREVAEVLDWMSTELTSGGSMNIDYLLDMAERHFEHANLDITASEIKHHLERGDLAAAQAALAAHKTVERPKQVGINPFRDTEAVEAAFKDSPVPLFLLPGAVGELLNDSLVRDFLLGIMGPEKRGKTFLLIELAFRALMARLNVAFFEVGDLSQNQLLRRLFIRLACKSDRAKYVGNLLVPMADCLWHQQGLCENMARPKGKVLRDAEGGLLGKDTDWAGHVPCDLCAKAQRPFPGVPAYKIKTVKAPLSLAEIPLLQDRMNRRLGKRMLKVACYPTNTFSVNDLDRTLDYWEDYEGFVPDLIIGDYADIFAPIDTRKDEQGQINDTWMGLRRVTQERHCLGIFPTQANAGSYGASSL